MAETQARLLALLSLLQTPREWPGPELADRLGVTTRTVRNDVERLRRLGYPVLAARGNVGGYRLSAGAAMPPLLLDDDEAVAVAVSLRTATGGAGMQESALRALTKLQQVLPKRLGRQVDALQTHTLRVAYRSRGPQTDTGALALLAAAARDREILRFAYRAHDGSESERRVEPYRLVSMGARWYLVAYDVDRDDWRTFRVDRVHGARSVGHRFALRPLPAEDVAAWVAGKTRQVRVRTRGRALVHAPAERVAQRFGPWLEGGSVEPVGPDRCRVTLGGRSVDEVAFWLGMLDCDFEADDSPELSEALRRLGERYTRAAG